MKYTDKRMDRIWKLEDSIADPENEVIMQWVSEQVSQLKLDVIQLQADQEAFKSELQSDFKKFKDEIVTQIRQNQASFREDMLKNKAILLSKINRKYDVLKLQIQCQVKEAFRDAMMSITDNAPSASPPAITTTPSQRPVSSTGVTPVTGKLEESDQSPSVKIKISPFYGFTNAQTQKGDALTDIQRAWLKHFNSTHESDRVTDVLALTAIREGVQDGVWEQGWTPGRTSSTFDQYLKEKCKQMRKPKYRNVRANLIDKLNSNMNRNMNAASKLAMVEIHETPTAAVPTLRGFQPTAGLRQSSILQGYKIGIDKEQTTSPPLKRSKEVKEVEINSSEESDPKDA